MKFESVIAKSFSESLFYIVFFFAGLISENSDIDGLSFLRGLLESLFEGLLEEL